MYIDEKRNITGFYLRPKFRRLGKKELIGGLEIDFLEKGSVILTEKFDLMDKKILDKIQEQLLEIVSMNLITADVEKCSKISKETKRIGVINMFKIEITEENEDATVNINIIFLKNGYFFLESTFKNVTEKKLEKIRDFLVDNTTYNFTCDKQCRAVDVLDMIAIINHKLQS